MKLIDSHCHIHDNDFPIAPEQVFTDALKNNVNTIICVGVDHDNSLLALDFVKRNSDKMELCAVVGVHPHEAKDYDEKELVDLIKAKKDSQLIGIGEIGLDYHYNNSSREDQLIALKSQLKIAKQFNLPISFHVRDAFDDFWQVIDEFTNEFGKVNGVLHSFTDTAECLNKALEYGFFIGLNGISTFVKKPEELEMFNQIPLDKIILETDAPFLSPSGQRGKVNQPANIKLIAQDLANKRNLELNEIASTTSQNVKKLFNI